MRNWGKRLPEGEAGRAAIDYAFGEASRQNNRTRSYVEAVLTRLEAEGWPADSGGRLEGRLRADV